MGAGPHCIPSVCVCWSLVRRLLEKHVGPFLLRTAFNQDTTAVVQTLIMQSCETKYELIDSGSGNTCASLPDPDVA